ncbi:anti-phage defense ZorAB system ZorA [Pseudomonas sp. MAP12]|uniref:Anti-phage defense ZorAB system ZorA n=1 Tax=Geopseudomonas aromaticivorans TaxID=2849492 RepID=A0ABS6MYV7_9GAMM|nr:anti-phage ZorAB system protein ZorA [Pseudomonas aromaticivorans]MBV2134001.1 anti-phage defense ZorAB system ZorA [Pseudomonas aromaticivorans]
MPGRLLFNTLDAEHFFNARTLASGLSGSRFLGSLPGLLVGLGVLATFVGLTIGLSKLKLDSSGGVEQLREGISVMIQGAAVAFMASVWGVGFSLVLNLIEKLTERWALGRIQNLQHHIDSVYPLIPAEQSLVHIADHSRESKEALQELHERIGDRLQESLNGMSEGMQLAITNALDNVMAPAIQTLVNSASQQSSEVLEKLVSNFMSGMTSAGREQGHLMQQAASDVHAAVGSMSERINQLAQTLDEQQSRQFSSAEQQRERFEAQLERITSVADHRQQQMEQRFGDLMGGLGGQLDSQLGAAHRRDEERQAMFERLLVETRTSQADLLERFAASTREQMQTMGEASNQRHDNLDKVFSRLMMTLNSQLDAQMNTAEQREQARAAHHQAQQTAVLNQQKQLLDSLGETGQKQIAAIAETSAAQQRNLEDTVGKLLAALNSQMTSHGQQAEEREQARSARHQAQQAAALDQQKQLLDSLGQTGQQQITAIAETSVAQQRNLEDTVGKLLATLNEQMSSHGQQAETREKERQQRLNEQLETMAAQQQQLLAEIARAVQATQLQSLQMADQHRQLMADLQQTSAAAAQSSKHMSNSASQLGVLAVNVQRAAELLGQRLEQVTLRIEEAGSQNAALAGQLQTQAGTLQQLQKALLESAQRFEQAASEARNGFGEMRSHQQEFLTGVRGEFADSTVIWPPIP